MKKICSLLLLLLSTQAYAQISLSGAIIDTAQHPVSGATIRLLEAGRHQVLQGTVSNTDGQFQLQGLQPGDYP